MTNATDGVVGPPNLSLDRLVDEIMALVTNNGGLGSPGQSERYLSALTTATDEEIVALSTMLGEVHSPGGEGLQIKVLAIQDARTDQALYRTLREAHEWSRAPMVTEESRQQGEALMKQMRADAAIELQKRIERKELITVGEFQELLQVSVCEIDSAVETGEMFYLIGPDGDRLYPAFYTDGKYDSSELKKVTQMLVGLPPSTKYHFFFRNCLSLGGRTPLVALTDGQLGKVLIAAASFVDR